jgi:hypothetical protein
MTWTFVWMMLILKIPIAALIYLVYWAIKQSPDQEPVPNESDGGMPRNPHPRKPLPRLPRRGPHGDPVPVSPPRVRSVAARARTLEH